MMNPFIVKKKNWFFVSLYLLWFLWQGDLANAENKICRIGLKNAEGKTVFLDVEIADTEFRRRKGLMFRKNLPTNRGMLFIFDVDHHPSFWMKNTYLPLSVAFVDRSGVIREIRDMDPLDEKTIHSSRWPVRYAIEVNRGWFSAHNISPGCKVFFNGCLGK
ncbi:MAG: DUF192 domain-containing protein [Spirochaetes bacterium]|nr:DUF192 domain-containing protein [Spirochaetota bacterium]